MAKSELTQEQMEAAAKVEAEAAEFKALEEQEAKDAAAKAKAEENEAVHLKALEQNAAAEAAAKADAAPADFVVATSKFDMRDPYVVVDTPEDAWLRAGEPKKVGHTGWLKAQIEAGYVTVAAE